ncbi:hypothetical protein M444_34560 (plasmid) [Streptomyces sp. Mg1]|nr:hypothetical protein M444_34560 [Streptomyces sp. Mg1]
MWRTTAEVAAGGKPVTDRVAPFHQGWRRQGDDVLRQPQQQEGQFRVGVCAAGVDRPAAQLHCGDVVEGGLHFL